MKAPRTRKETALKTSKSSLPDLMSLRASDLMSEDLVTVNPDTPVEDVLMRFEEYGVSALPVVDDAGAPIGIVSKADVARLDRMRDEKLEGRPGDRVYDERAEDEGPEFPGREDYSPELLGRAVAADWMHPAVVDVGPDATLGEICRRMLEEGIHHIVVLERHKAVGMISSLDIVGAVADRS